MDGPGGGLGVNEVTMDTRRSTGSRGVQGQGGSAGAAGGVTAGAKSGRGNDRSGGRMRGWGREGSEVGDAADGSSTTPFNILREGMVGPAGRGSIEGGVFGHGGISPGPSAQEGGVGGGGWGRGGAKWEEEGELSCRCRQALRARPHRKSPRSRGR